MNPIRSIRIWVIYFLLVCPLLASAEGFKVGPYEADTNDVLRILGIRHLGATVTLPEPVKGIEARIRLDLYRKGKKLLNPGDLNTFGITEEMQTVAVSVDIADTDKMAIPGAPPKTHRFFVKLENCGQGGMVGSTTMDVPKTDFNAERGGASGLIAQNHPELSNTEDGVSELPLICYVTGNVNHTMMKGNVNETIAANPDADILIVVFEYKVKSAKQAAD